MKLKHRILALLTAISIIGGATNYARAYGEEVGIDYSNTSITTVDSVKTTTVLVTDPLAEQTTSPKIKPVSDDNAAVRAAIAFTPELNSVYEDQLKRRVAELAAKQAAIELAKKRAAEEAARPKITYGSKLGIPSAARAFKSYMPYKAITCKSSPQYKIQRSGAYTDRNGIRRLNGDYMIAVGTYYAKKGVGTRLRVTMENGQVFNAVVGDIKANQDTNSTHQYHTSDGSVVEFIIDGKKLSKNIRRMGDVSYASGINLQGRIAYMQTISIG